MSGEPTTCETDERRLFMRAPQPVAVLEALRPSEASPARPRGLAALNRRRWRVPGLNLHLHSATVLEWERGILFLLIAPALAVGVLLYLALPVEPQLWALMVLTLVLAAACYAARSRPRLNVGLAFLLLVVIGATAARLETWRASTRMIGSDITTRLSGRVIDLDHLANGRIRMTVDVISTERPTLRYAPQRVRVSASAVPAGIRAGSTIKGLVKLFPPSGPLRPGSYDFSFESYFDGIGANGFFFRAPELMSEAGPSESGARFTVAVDNFRNRIAGHIRDRIGGAEGEIAAALVVGVRAGIPEAVNEDLRRTGLAHILSISGLHMALVAASIMGVLRLGFAAFPDFASRHAVKKVAAAIALVVVAAYLFVSGAEVAARRSFIMLAVMLVAVMFDRAALTMRNLAIAAIATIVVSPHEVVGPSFQMSFAATAALIGGYAAWTQWSQKRPQDHQRSMTRWLLGKTVTLLAGIAATALIAGLATTIYGAWHFQRVSPLSLVANLAVTPIISVVMWSGVLASIAMPFGLDGPFLALMGKGLAAMLAVADWLSARSPLDAVGIIPVASVLLLTLALLTATLATTRLRIVALPLAACGLWLLVGRTVPGVLVAEDGRLVGVMQADGALAINRERPNGFTVEDWQRALVVSRLVKPEQHSDGGEPTVGHRATDDDEQGREATSDTSSKPGGGPGLKRASDLAASGVPDQRNSSDTGFICMDGVCVAQHRGGGLVVHTEKAEDIVDYCGSAELIVTADATAGNPCYPGEAMVITARDLARKGAASVELQSGADQQAVAMVTHAIDQPYRAWHESRAFSRAARGKAPYVPKARTSGQPPTRIQPAAE